MEPQPVIFQNPETAAQYQTTMTMDMIVHLPGKNYRNRISMIPPGIAAILIEQGFTWVTKKQVAALSAPAATEQE